MKWQGWVGLLGLIFVELVYLARTGKTAEANYGKTSWEEKRAMFIWLGISFMLWVSGWNLP